MAKLIHIKNSKYGDIAILIDGDFWEAQRNTDAVVYTPQEIEEFKEMSEDERQWIHEGKKQFAGRMVLPGHEDEPEVQKCGLAEYRKKRNAERKVDNQ